ncbi:MAG: hypothetical protein CMQ40_00460 [Gammaproteobacteria bacterium]|nr:hypothetical protein [Gammaproteobacteria bacterium]
MSDTDEHKDPDSDQETKSETPETGPSEPDNGNPEEISAEPEMIEDENSTEGDVAGENSADKNSEETAVAGDEIVASEESLPIETPAADQAEEKSAPETETPDAEPQDKNMEEQPVSTEETSQDFTPEDTEKSPDLPDNAVEIEGGGSVDDGTVKLRINGVDVGPLTHIDRTLAVTSEQISKAKTLIYVTSSITGFVLVVSILFYVALSVQLAQKTNELDRMLLAVAKRGIQLGNGIEKIADVENYLVDLQNNQSLLKSDVGKLDESGQSLDQKLAKTEATLLETFSKGNASYRDIETKNLKNLLSELGALKRNQQELSKLGKIDRNQEKISSELRKLETRLLEIQAKVNDLYIIRQAELNAALKAD